MIFTLQVVSATESEAYIHVVKTMIQLGIEHGLGQTSRCVAK